MKVTAKNLGNIAILEIEGEIDAEYAPQFKKSLAKLSLERQKKIILDLNKVTFVDSTGLGVMISLMRQLKEQEGELRLVGLQEEVRSVFEITRLYKVFEICSSIEEAVKDIKKGNPRDVPCH